MSVTAMDRREAVSKILSKRSDALVVTGLGSASYDVHAYGDDPANYYLWGAMGGAALTGLGLAQAQPDRRIVVLTGDGEMLMAYGALATIAVAKPINLDIVVIDNGHFGETGMQDSHTGRGLDLAAVAAASGIPRTATLTSTDEVTAFADTLSMPPEGPRFTVLKVAAENLPRSLPPRDATYIKTRFRENLGFDPC